jgi:glutamate racemase
LKNLPIGVFDSGIGGLTVLRALAEALPHERFLYLGDTARLPYGTKSAETVVRYALQATDQLIARGVKCLVVACNTASAAALPAIRARHPELPEVGVVEPGAQAAAAATRNGRIAVIATEATVRGGAYQAAIARLRPQASVQALACQLFVALAEEGWTEGAVVRATAEQYLRPLFDAADAPDTLVLGCTHFPALQPVIGAVVGSGVSIVDSATTTARSVQALLSQHGQLCARGADADAPPRVRFLATDGAARFAAIGSRFLGQPIRPEQIEVIDL